MKVINRPMHFAENRPFVAQLVPGEFFVIVNFKYHVIDFTIPFSKFTTGKDKHFHFIKNKNSVIKKISGAGGVGSSFFFEHVLGTQTFDKWITSIEYVQGYTLIGFEDGRILKINGTGGTGAHMFNVVESPLGFTHYDTAYQTYLNGSHKFFKPILDIVYVANKTLICFEGGKILKIVGAGGSGYNLFAIVEYTSSFTGITGYPYYEGHQILNSDVTNITVVGGLLLIATKDGRQLKVAGSGGAGSNMFKITQTSYGYAALPWTYELHGSNKFMGYIVKSLVVGNETFFSFNNGKIIKIVGAGSTGSNMFNLNETIGSFETSSTLYFVCLLGAYKFPNDYVFDLKYINGYLFVLLTDGFILKILGTGGGLQNMFNIKYEWDYTQQHKVYSTWSGSFAAFLFGQQLMFPNVSYLEQIVQLDEFIFVTYRDLNSNTFVLKLKAVVASNDFIDMFGLDYPTSLSYGQCYNSDGTPTSAYVGCQKVTSPD